jgi:hypothetical protein
MRRLPITQRLQQWLLFAALATVTVNAMQAQNVPAISGGVGFLSNNNGFDTNFQPAVAPLIALPLGPHLLVESRGDIREIGTQTTPSSSNSSRFIASLIYLQPFQFFAP